MRTWLILPALALSALGGLALFGAGSSETAERTELVRLAALQPTDTLSDACVWTPEAAAAGEPSPCGTTTPVLAAVEPQPPSKPMRALVWPDDFIALTVVAATEVWQATLDFVSGLYDSAFGGEEPKDPSDA